MTRNDDWPTVAYSSSGLTSTNSVQVSAGFSNLRTETTEFLSDKSHLKRLGKKKTELLWWIENLKISNERKRRLQEPHLLMQTDTSIKDWGAHYSGISTGKKKTFA